MMFGTATCNSVFGELITILQSFDEQAGAIAQVTSGGDQISSVVQTNCAAAEKSAAASEELSSQATMLKQLVGQFNLRNETQLVVYHEERVDIGGK